MAQLSIQYQTDTFVFNDLSTVFFSPQNDFLIVSHLPHEEDKNGVTILSLGDFKIQRQIPYLILRNARIDLSPDGKLLAGSGYQQETVTQHLRIFDWEKEYLQYQSDITWAWDISATRWSPDYRWLATGALDGRVTVHQTDDYQVILDYKIQGNRIAAIDVSPDSRFLAVGGSEKAIFIWDAGDWNALARQIETESSIQSLRFSPDGSMLVAATPRGIYFWKTESWQPFSPVTTKDDFSALAFSPDGLLLAVGTSSGRILLWRTDTWEYLTEIREQKTRIAALSFSPDGQFLASLSISTFQPAEKDPAEQGQKSQLIVWGLKTR